MSQTQQCHFHQRKCVSKAIDIIEKESKPSAYWGLEYLEKKIESETRKGNHEEMANGWMITTALSASNLLSNAFPNWKDGRF